MKKLKSRQRHIPGALWSRVIFICGAATMVCLGEPPDRSLGTTNAVGNPVNYPEYAGNVKNIDSRPFYRSSELFRSGQSACYNENAETFLEIGEAMGRTMLELLKAVEEAKQTGMKGPK